MKKVIFALLFFVLFGCNDETTVSSIKTNEDNSSEDATVQEDTTISEGDTVSEDTIVPEVDTASSSLDNGSKLLWPIDCIPEENCTLGHADVDSDGVAFDCSEPGYIGHQGTDISLISWEQMDEGVSVYSAQSGTVLWAFDHPMAFDRCTTDSTEADCLEPNTSLYAGMDNGYAVCTELGSYCSLVSNNSSCYYCFYGKNVIVIKHDEGDIFATRYDHLKSGSLLVSEGDYVERGEKIAEVGSAGNSTGPHLHFEVWGNDYYSLSEPFFGECGPNYSESLWGVEREPWNNRNNRDATHDRF